jgi:hypothetical protein
MIKGAFCSISTLSMGGILGSGKTLLAANGGGPSISSTPKETYRKTPTVPVFQNMNEQEITDWSVAYQRAYDQIVVSLKHLLKPGLYGYYNRWFDKTNNSERKQTVKANLARMANLMADNPVLFIKTNAYCDDLSTGDKVATTNEGGSINLCWRAFDDFWLFYTGATQTKEWTRAFIVIHEISHAAARTDDVWYNWLICKSNAISPDTKVRNAQNYALFAMETDISRLPYVPEGKIDLKTDDMIYLKANNNRYLNAQPYLDKGDYIVASTPESDLKNTNECKFTVTVSPDDPSKIFLQSWDGKWLYLPEGDNYIRTGQAFRPKDVPFTVGEFEVFKGVDVNGATKTDKLLVLQARDGKLLAQTRENPSYIRAINAVVDQWCLFKLTLASRA